MFRVLALDGSVLATLAVPSTGRQIKEELWRQGEKEFFDLVYEGHVLEDAAAAAHGDVSAVRRAPPNVLVCTNESVAFFELGSKKKLYSQPLRQPVGAQCSPDGMLWLVACGDGLVEVYDGEQRLWSWRGAPRRSFNVTWSRDSRSVLVPMESWARLFDARSGEVLQSLGGFETDVLVGVWGPEESWVLVSRDGFAKIWQGEEAEGLVMSQVGKWTSSVRLFEDLLLALLRDGTARLFGRDGEVRLTLPARMRVSEAAVAREMILLVLCDCTAQLYHMEKTKVTKTLELGTMGIFIPPYPISFSKDGSKLLLALDSCDVKVFDTQTASLISTCKGEDHHITSASFSPDGGEVLVSYYHPVATIFETASGAPKANLDLPGAIYSTSSFA